MIKMLTSGDRISTEKKNQQRFQFTPYAKLVFSANEIPESEDKTYAWYRRFIIFHCENIFEGDTKDPNLIEKLTTPEETSGLLNLALNGLRRLIKNGEFDYTDDIKAIARDYNLNSNTVDKFLEQKCEITGKDEDYIICRDLRGTYFNFCKLEGLHPKSDNIFGMELSAKVIKHRMRIKGERENRYIGIRLKNENQDNLTMCP